MNIESVCGITCDDVLACDSGQRAFESVLGRLVARDLPSVLGRYIQFNSVFGAGVSNLAGQIAGRQELFRDSAEKCDRLADRSSEVASEIFYAAIDEFGDHSGNHRGTHRTLAQATLRAVSEYFGCGTADLNDAGFISSGTWGAIERVRAGYALSGPVTGERLLRGVGFHVASETLADCEFRLLDTALRVRFPDLVKWLEAASVIVGDASYPGYVWIQIHTTAEAAHSLAAFTGVERAIRFYAGPGGGDRAHGLVMEGVNEFGAVQRDFMNQLIS